MGGHALVLVQSDTSWADGVRTGVARAGFWGLLGIAVFAGGLGAWSVLAPLSSAAVAPGVVAAAGRNQVVQHLEGGIISQILVHEGDRVTKGQALFKLDPTAALSQRDRIQKELISLRAQALRLEAEVTGAETLGFPAALQQAAKSAGLTQLLNEQQTEFAAGLARYHQEIAILQQRIKALQDQIGGAQVQKQAMDTQLGLIRDELDRKKKLLDKGLGLRSDYTNLLRSEADLVGRSGQMSATILSNRTQIVENHAQLARLGTQRSEQAANKLSTVRTQITDDTEKLAAAEDVLSRITVRAPSNGIVVASYYNTPGSVVAPGSTMLELLPTSDDLIVQAQVSPRNIDMVHVGEKAELRFTSLNARTTPRVDARVIYVSADRIVGNGQGATPSRQSYYIARLRLTNNLPPQIKRSEIYPGMPVETYIKTGQRTFLSYLLKPIEDSFARAFRER